MTIQEINDEIKYDKIHRFDNISAELGHFVGFVIKLMINTPAVAFIMYYCQEKMKNENLTRLHPSQQRSN